MARFGPGGRIESGGVQTPVVAFIVAVCLVGTYLSYRLGNSEVDSRAEVFGQDVAKAQLASLSHELQECLGSMMGVQGRDGSRKLPPALAAIQAQAARLEEEESQLEAQFHQCVTDEQAQQETFSEEDKRNAAKIKQLRERLQVQRGNAAHLQKARGMNLVLLETGLAQLVEQHNYLKKILGEEQVTGKEGIEAHLATLSQKWASSTNIPLSEIMQRKRESLREVKTNITDNYDRSKEKKAKVFFQNRDESGDYRRPEWRGKTQRPVAKGVKETDYVVTSPLPHLMHVLYDYALCAMQSKDDFMYPLHYRISAKSSQVYRLNEVLDTPLVTFCHACLPKENTPEFRIACNGHRTDDLYGSIRFWRMRSRMRFAPAILHEADSFRSDNGIEYALAVRLPRSAAFVRECEKQPQPQLAYRRLLRGKATELDLSDDSRCAPSDGRLVKAINALAERLGVDRIYLTSDGPTEEIDAVAQQLKKPVVRGETATGDPHAVAKDIVVASKSKYILISRFEAHSSQITELFLLENELRTENIFVW